MLAGTEVNVSHWYHLLLLLLLCQKGEVATCLKIEHGRNTRRLERRSVSLISLKWFFLLFFLSFTFLPEVDITVHLHFFLSLLSSSQGQNLAMGEGGIKQLEIFKTENEEKKVMGNEELIKY